MSMIYAAVTYTADKDVVSFVQAVEAVAPADAEAAVAVVTILTDLLHLLGDEDRVLFLRLVELTEWDAAIRVWRKLHTLNGVQSAVTLTVRVAALRERRITPDFIDTTARRLLKENT